LIGRVRKRVRPIALGRGFILRDVAKFKEECTWALGSKNEQGQRFRRKFTIKYSQNNRLQTYQFSNNKISDFDRIHAVCGKKWLSLWKRA
jgi:hypothetical protein